MQDIKNTANKTTNPLIFLASVLKPLDDIRMYGKLALGVRYCLPQTSIHLFGRSVTMPKSMPDGFHTHPLRLGRRWGWRRLWAWWQFWRTLRRLRPQVVVVCALELLPWACLYKYWVGCEVVYDMQENYSHNLRYGRTYPYLWRKPLTWLIETLERMVYPSLAQLWLAEYCYAEEIPWISGGIGNTKAPVFILPNKALVEMHKTPATVSEKKLNLVCTGTLSEPYGITEAIAQTLALSSAGYPVQLYLVGYAPQEMYAQKLHSLAAQYPELIYWIREGDGTQPVPHGRCMAYMQAADWVLLPYRLTSNLRARIPTRMYEALALGKPMLITHNEAWSQFLTQYPASRSCFTDWQEAPEQLWNKIYPPPKKAKPLKEALWGEAEYLTLQQATKHWTLSF
jgi:glycosyltransferase involved in cell wall biosynthesis